jgi:HEAT repeat protein
MGVRSFEGLISAVSAPDVPVETRVIAGEMLGLGHEVWDPNLCVEALLIALKDQKVTLRDVAARSLRFFSHKESLQPLIAAALEDESPVVRVAAIQVLQYVGDESAVGPLITMLRNQGETLSLRTLAAEVLGHLRAGQAVSVLIEALTDDSEEMRFYAAFSLGLIGDERALPELMRLAGEDQAPIHGMWSVSKEASDAIERIRQRSGAEPYL